MSFTVWVKSVAQATDNAAGDLVKDMRQDLRLPLFETVQHMRRYLKAHNACEGAIGAADTVWRRFKAWDKR
jgi:hypothetical protein